MQMSGPGACPVWSTTLGHGPRHALLIHASLSRGKSWSGMMQRLDDRLTATVFDLPGHGASGDWDGTGDIHDSATGIAAGLLAPGASDLIGHSFGATVALRLALEQPERVRSLTLIEPVLFAAVRHAPGMAPQIADNDRMAALLARGDRDQAARLFTAQWGVGIGWDQMPDFQRAYIAARMDLIVAAAPVLFDDRPGMLGAGRLERLQLPVLLIGGTASPPIMGKIIAALAARLSNARRVVIDGAGHMAPVTHPGKVAAAISAFLSETGPD